MSDVIDLAQDYEERHREAALAAHRAAHHAPAATSAPVARDCRSCGDPIPAERLAAQPDAQECVPCIQLRERTFGR
jgi:DnaK suppressor protein